MKQEVINKEFELNGSESTNINNAIVISVNDDSVSEFKPIDLNDTDLIDNYFNDMNSTEIDFPEFIDYENPRS